MVGGALWHRSGRELHPNRLASGSLSAWALRPDCQVPRKKAVLLPGFLHHWSPRRLHNPALRNPLSRALYLLIRIMTSVIFPLGHYFVHKISMGSKLFIIFSTNIHENI